MMIKRIYLASVYRLKYEKCEPYIIQKLLSHIEFEIKYRDLIPLNNKETRVPYKICSFDIEASSSHGDFPVPKKSYKKLSTNIFLKIPTQTSGMLKE